MLQPTPLRSIVFYVTSVLILNTLQFKESTATTTTGTEETVPDANRRQLWSGNLRDPKDVIQKTDQNQNINNDPPVSIYRQVGSSMGKPFQPWNFNENPFPCVRMGSPNTDGFMYIKVPKTSSSMNAFTTKRIALRHADEFGVKERCKVQGLSHIRATDMMCKNRNKAKSFLWTLLRDPTQRKISYYGMKMRQWEEQNNVKADHNDADFITYMNQQLQMQTTQLSYINVEGPIPLDPSIDWLQSKIQATLDEYNFVGVFERREESMVALQLILGLDMYDILFPWKENYCDASEKYFLTDGMKEYLNSDTWLNAKSIKADTMLFEAANRSLDLTIQRLGEERFQQALNNYRSMLQRGYMLLESQEKKGCGIPHLWKLRDEDLDRLAQMNN